MRPDLLPPNSTPLEQKLSAACQPGILELGDAAIRGRKFDPPDNWLDALIYEYALGEISPWITDKRRLIAEGVKWTRLRGTPASLHLAFSWVGIPAEIEEEVPGHPNHFAEYQISPAEVLPAEKLCVLVRLALLSQPVRSRLSRFYHGYDVRRLVLDSGRLDEHLLSADSGVRPHREEMNCLPWNSADGQFIPPLISFGEFFAARVVADEPIVQASTTITIARRITGWQADMPILDDLPEHREIEVGMLTKGQVGAHIVYAGQVWTGVNWAAADSWSGTKVIVSGSH